MKYLQIALILIFNLVSSARAADAMVDFYGILDVAWGYQSNGLPDNAHNGASVVSTVFSNAANPNVGSHSTVWSGGISQNRVGLKGSKDFQAGWRAGYLLETGFNPVSGRLVNNAQGLADNAPATSAGYGSVSSNGSQNGQLLNREAYASVGRDAWGDFRVGRNNTLINDAAQQYDPTQSSQLFGYLTASSGFGGGSGVSETTRLNKSIKYRHKIGDFSVGLMHAWGDGTALAPQGHMNGASVGYASGPVRLDVAYSKQTNAIKESVASAVGAIHDISATAYNSTGWLLGLNYDLAPAWTIKAGASHYALSSPNDNIAAGLTSMNGLVVSSPVNYQGATIAAQLDWLGLNHKATDKLTLYAGYYRATYEGYRSTVATTAFNATSGQVNWISLLADYQLDSTKDVYAALANIGLTNTGTTSAITGSIKSGSSYAPIADNRLVAVGFRYKF